MSSPDEMLHQVGAFEVFEAKKVLDAFEAEAIPFEIEKDDTALEAPGHSLQQSLGGYPDDSKLLVFVPESYLSKAKAILDRLFPV